MMTRTLASLLSLFALCTLFLPLSQTAFAEPPKPLSALTDESVSSLLAKGDQLFPQSTCTNKLGALNGAIDAYSRAWIQAKGNDLPLASHKFAQSRIKAGECFLAETQYDEALNHYLAALALLRYPTLSLETVDLDQSDAYEKLAQQIRATLPLITPSVDTIQDFHKMGKARLQQSRHLSALGLYIMAETMTPQDKETTHSIESILQKIQQRRHELDSKRDSVWVPYISNDKSEKKFISYISQKVRNNWQAPVLNGHYKGSVDFRVNSDGSLSDISIRKTSDHINFDASMIRAVQKTSPIPAKGLLTKVLQGKSYITVNEVFDYEPKPIPYY